MPKVLGLRTLRFSASLILFALVANSYASDPSTPVTVTSVQIGPVGLYTCEVVSSRPDPTGGTSRTERDCRLTEETSTIAAKIGLRFGCSYKVLGSPQGATIDTVKRWRFPNPGIKNPETGETLFERDYGGRAVIGGGSSQATWTFDPGEIVPGKWIVEITYDGRVLNSCTFNIKS